VNAGSAAATPAQANGPGAGEMVAMLERMLLIPRVEEHLGDYSVAGRLPGKVHHLETDKVVQVVEATADGTLLGILVPAGEDAMVGAAVALIRMRGAGR
jgi:hypothetical protein